MALASEMAGLDLEDIYHLNPGFSRWATDPAGPQQLLLPLDKATDFSINLGNMPDAKLIEWRQHQVHKGESLAQLAQQYGTTPEVLRQINNLGPDRLKTGQTLLIPLAQKTTYALVSENETRKTKRGSAGAQAGTIHKVRSGESLWSIARKYDVPVTQLAALNKLSPGSPLHAGKKITVRKLSANHDDAGADDSDSARIQLVKYIVRKGDNLFRIAQKFNVTVQSVLKWNSELLGGNNSIRPGQKLTLFVDNKRGDANG
jgi:membrane-bound lytic murein transglycosylase D